MPAQFPYLGLKFGEMSLPNHSVHLPGTIALTGQKPIRMIRAHENCDAAKQLDLRGLAARGASVSVL